MQPIIIITDTINNKTFNINKNREWSQTHPYITNKQLKWTPWER